MMQFFNSHSRRLTWISSEEKDKPLHQQAEVLMKDRLTAGETIRFLFSAGEELVLFTEQRLVWIDRSSASLLRTTATLPYRQLTQLETDTPEGDEPSAVQPVLRISGPEGRETEFWFTDSETAFPAEQLAKLEALIAAGML